MKRVSANSETGLKRARNPATESTCAQGGQNYQPTVKREQRGHHSAHQAVPTMGGEAHSAHQGCSHHGRTGHTLRIRTVPTMGGELFAHQDCSHHGKESSLRRGFSSLSLRWVPSLRRGFSQRMVHPLHTVVGRSVHPVTHGSREAGTPTKVHREAYTHSEALGSLFVGVFHTQ